MRKSLVVKLVLLNSVLALSGCSRTCEREDKDKEEPGKPSSTCRGSSHRSGGHFFYWGGGGHTGSVRGGQPGTGSVTRGGFGSTGHAVS